MSVCRQFRSSVLNYKQFFLRNIEFRKIHAYGVLPKANTEYLDLEISGKSMSFPYVWLRDNCQCELCFHHTAKSRIIDWSGFNLNIKPKNVLKDENTVQVIWEDDHISKFALNWLIFRSFSKENQKEYANTLYRPHKITWHGVDFSKILSKHDYTEILDSDQAAYNWLKKFTTYGVVLIENAPDSENAINNIVQRIGFPKRTHYGEKYIVQHITNTNNVAYLSSNLQLHTDLPYYEYVPGANLLHCYVQTESTGGENLLSDCHYTAAYMREQYPEKFNILTDVEVEWTDRGTENGSEFYKLYRSPIICLDRHKEITRINFSIPQRSTFFPGPIDLVKPWYEAHSLFFELNKKFSAKFKTKVGDILMFDNIRLLHGRNGYEDKKDNVRKLIAAFVDWDEIYSRFRCLKVKLNPTPEA